MKNHRKTKRLHYGLAGVLLAMLVALGMVRNEHSDTAQASGGQQLTVHYIDVGQGDATLITLGEHAMLIDAGPQDSGTKLQLYLQKQDINSLDYVILTHPDADHIGGADVILTKFRCGQVMMNGQTKDTACYRDVEAALTYKGYQATTPAAGSSYLLGDAKFTVLGPVQMTEDANNASIAVLLTYGDTRFLFTGDAQEDEERDILQSGQDVSANVYQAGHHGSRTSSSEAFMQAVCPQYAVISCSEDNSYGHPHAEVLNRFRTMGIKVFRTDEQGSLIASSDGSTITWNASPSETWKAGEPTGSSKPQAAGQYQYEKKAQADTLEATAEAQEYILNTSTHKFHRADCSSVSDMAEKNKQASTESRDAIIASGYEPCKRCNP